MQQTWENIWKQFEKSSNEFDSYIDSGIPTISQNKVKRFIREFDKLKDLANDFDKLMQNPIDPVDINIPFEEQAFIDTWKYWKEYLLETFGKSYKSREEQMALEYLEELSSGDPSKAIRYLKYSMANGYRKFFEVTEKNYKAPKETNHGDSDFD